MQVFLPAVTGRVLQATHVPMLLGINTHFCALAGLLFYKTEVGVLCSHLSPHDRPRRPRPAGPDSAALLCLLTGGNHTLVPPFTDSSPNNASGLHLSLGACVPLLL